MKNFLKFSAVFAIVVGLLMVAGGIWGIVFTHKNVTQEKIVTPEDARLAGVEVRGPLSLKAQVDIIREHALRSTGGKTYAEMDRMVPLVDENGNVVTDENGEVAMVENTARNIWITATALTTALHLAIFAYVFSVLSILFGLVSLWNGFLFSRMAKNK